MANDLKDAVAKAAQEFTSQVLSIFAEAFQNVAGSIPSARTASSPSKKAPAKPTKAAKAPVAKAPGRPAKGAKPQAAKKPEPGKRIRRSEADLAKMGEDVVKLLQKNKSGLRIEQINKQLGTETKELMRPILKLLEEGKLRKEGERRATTYFAA